MVLSEKERKERLHDMNNYYEDCKRLEEEEEERFAEAIREAQSENE